jgi:Ni,Fe-hydrogenase III small subunit
MPSNESPLRPIIAKWLSKLKFAADYKQRTFGDDARECMQFFNGPYDWLYGSGNTQHAGLTVSYNQVPSPKFRMSANKVAEMVQLFGPTLYQKNPHRTITPRAIPVPPMPPQLMQAQQMLQQMQQMMQPGMPPPPPQVMQQMMQAQQQMQMWQQMQQQDTVKSELNKTRAMLLDTYLNYTPNELGFLFDVRAAIDETIIKGASCLWTEIYTAPTGLKMVGSFYDTIDNLYLDPDAEKLDDCKWIARRCMHPVWEVEREYGLPAGSLKPNAESWDSQADYDPDAHRRWKRAQGGTNDIITYWKIYSTMGVGGRLNDAVPDYREILDSYGDNCFMVIADGCDYMLNVPDEIIGSAGDDEIQRRLQWPLPYWMNGSWPVEMFEFHRVPRQVWPMSHLKPGLGELKFLNWAYSFLASKMPTLGRNFLAMPKGLSEKNKTAINSGDDMTVLELDAMQTNITGMLQSTNSGTVLGDIYKIIDMVGQQFERRVGLNELQYGESKRQMRSAAEAEAKQSAISIRPDDMRTKIVQKLSNVAQKEAIAAQLLLGPEDLTPIIGDLGTLAWQMSLAECDINDIIHKLDFRIEADDTRVPNREQIAQNMQTAITTLFQFLMNFGLQTGQFDPINALITDWAKSIDLESSRYILTPPPPPPPAPPTPPKISVSLKGEDLPPLGLVPFIMDDFGAPPPAPPTAGGNQPLPASPPPAAPPR